MGRCQNKDHQEWFQKNEIVQMTVVFKFQYQSSRMNILKTSRPTASRPTGAAQGGSGRANKQIFFSTNNQGYLINLFERRVRQVIRKPGTGENYALEAPKPRYRKNLKIAEFWHFPPC
jgi:hypothetical protein